MDELDIMKEAEERQSSPNNRPNLEERKKIKEIIFLKEEEWKEKKRKCWNKGSKTVA